MCTLMIIIYLAINLFAVCNAKVDVQSIFVPRFVENGTEDSVVLDCIYTLDPIDDKNLVVKWFLNDDPEPIYQWIPEVGSRHASKRLQGRINMDFAVNTADPMTKYRALNILRPTIDLSGKYACHVMSLSNQDSAEETMIVYAKPKSFDFNYTRPEKSQLALRTRKGTKWYKPSSSQSLPSSESASPDAHHSDYSQHQHHHQQQQRDMSEWQESSATLKCQVKDVFPLPEMTIYRVSDDSKTEALHEIEQKIERNPNGAYNVTITSDIRDNELIDTYGSHSNNYECLLILPDGSKANYQRKKRITYFTENGPINRSVLVQNDYHLISIVFTILLFLGLKYS